MKNIQTAAITQQGAPDARAWSQQAAVALWFLNGTPSSGILTLGATNRLRADS